MHVIELTDYLVPNAKNKKFCKQLVRDIERDYKGVSAIVSERVYNKEEQKEIDVISVKVTQSYWNFCANWVLNHSNIKNTTKI